MRSGTDLVSVLIFRHLDQSLGVWHRQTQQQMALTNEKIAVFAPIPSASDEIATKVNTGLERKLRNAYRKSCTNVSIIAPPQVSRVFSLIRSDCQMCAGQRNELHPPQSTLRCSSASNSRCERTRGLALARVSCCARTTLLSPPPPATSRALWLRSAVSISIPPPIAAFCRLR